LRKALALKADEAALVVSDLQGVPDPLFIARALAAAIRKLGPVDLVLTGREAGDWGAGQTGGLLAEELGVPSVSFVEDVEPGSPGSLNVKRQTDSGWESFEATLPLVATITNHEKNVPRIPKTRDVMQSFRKPITKWTLAELDLDPSQANSYYEVAELSIPRKETQCEFVAGETLEEKVSGFARRVTEIMRSI
jgi:electron transfer flavoprotein beta subunit